MLLSYKGLNKNCGGGCSKKLSHVLFLLHMLIMLAHSLNVAFIKHLTVGVSTLNGYHITATSRYSKHHGILSICYRQIMHKFLNKKNSNIAKEDVDQSTLSEFKDIQVECSSVYLFFRTKHAKD